MSIRESRARMRSILAGDRCVSMASIFDPISARLAQHLGFEAGLMGGSLVSHVVLGAPDLILITLTELAEQVRRCARVSAVPILVDADHGYGNALNVMRTIRELDDAGASAAMIEDTALPRAYGQQAAAQLLPLDESVAKIRAAVDARGDSDLLVLGRTSAASLVGVDDAIARFRAYEAEGVDALFMPGVRTLADRKRRDAARHAQLAISPRENAAGNKLVAVPSHFFHCARCIVVSPWGA